MLWEAPKSPSTKTIYVLIFSGAPWVPRHQNKSNFNVLASPRVPEHQNGSYLRSAPVQLHDLSCVGVLGSLWVPRHQNSSYLSCTRTCSSTIRAVWCCRKPHGSQSTKTVHIFELHRAARLYGLFSSQSIKNVHTFKLNQWVPEHQDSSYIRVAGAARRYELFWDSGHQSNAYLRVAPCRLTI